MSVEDFRLYSVIQSLDDVPDTYQIEDIEGYEIYKTHFNDETYFIFDEEHKVYRSLIYEGTDPDAKKKLKFYISEYYEDLSDDDKSTLVNDFSSKKKNPYPDNLKE